MSNPFNNPFGSSFDDIFNSREAKKPEKGVPWEAKVIDGGVLRPALSGSRTAQNKRGIARRR